VEGQLELLPPIRQDGDIPRKLYAVPNKQTKPTTSWTYSTNVTANDIESSYYLYEKDQDSLTYIQEVVTHFIHKVTV